MRTILAISMTLVVFCLQGCGGAQVQGAAVAAADPAPAAAQPVAAAPTEAVCPVSGEKVTPDVHTKSTVYNAKTYYFCCPGCEKKFNADPAKYVAAVAAGSPNEPCTDEGGKEPEKKGEKSGK